MQTEVDARTRHCDICEKTYHFSEMHQHLHRDVMPTEVKKDKKTK